MRFTNVLFKASRVREMRFMWKARGFVRPMPAPESWYLEGKEVIDPVIVRDPRFDQFDRNMHSEDAKPDISRWFTQLQPALEDHMNYHEDFVYEYNTASRLAGGLQQACIITKTTPRFTLPHRITDNINLLQVPHQDELVQRAIMQANIWDPMKVKLPKRISRLIPGWKFKAEYGITQLRIRMVLMQNLVRLCQSLNGKYPDLLLSRDILRKCFIDATYNINDAVIMVRGIQDYVLNSNRPLELFANSDEVDETAAENLPSMDPISPLIDLTHTNVYKDGLNVTGFHDAYQFQHPHTLFLSTRMNRTDGDHKTTLLMYCFANCLARAKAKYGAEVTELPEPIMIQAILTDSIRFHFACFQLNTLQMNNTTGVKNIIWIDSGNRMYNKIVPKRSMLRNTLYEDYDPEVFRKFLAMYATDADLSAMEHKAVTSG